MHQRYSLSSSEVKKKRKKKDTKDMRFAPEGSSHAWILKLKAVGKVKLCKKKSARFHEHPEGRENHLFE